MKKYLIKNNQLFTHVIADKIFVNEFGQIIFYKNEEIICVVPIETTVILTD